MIQIVQLGDVAISDGKMSDDKTSHCLVTRAAQK